MKAPQGRNSREGTMENARAQKKQTGQTSSGARALWDPFGFMQMFGWGRASGDAPLFNVEETDDTYVCKVNVKLTLPGQADVAHAKAELENGELTLVVPKAMTAMPEPAAAVPEPAPAMPEASAATPESTNATPEASAATPEPASPPRRTRRAKGTGKAGASAGGGARRGTRTRGRRG
jgi:HSP20 family molecular chaperone IbpA